MAPDPVVGWVFSSLLLSLRVSPVFALAPPFSLTRVPIMFRALFGVAIAACLSAAYPQATSITDLSVGALLLTALRELFLGSVFVLAFQLTFGALYTAGRTIDIQAGFGLALLIDPTSQNQTPLVGTLFAYAAGAVFFAMDGHVVILHIVAASLEAVPLGQAHLPTSLEPLVAFVSIIFLLSFGVAGGVVLSLFLADIGIALLSRTAPQMNALVLGFQVKTIVTILTLATSLGLSGALLARMVTVTLEAIPRLL